VEPESEVKKEIPAHWFHPIDDADVAAAFHGAAREGTVELTRDAKAKPAMRLSAD
jgi:hypothetical protein